MTTKKKAPAAVTAPSSTKSHESNPGNKDIECTMDQEDIVDRQALLVARVESYLFENQDEDQVDIEKLTTHLRRRYKDYRNKNTRPTYSMVAHAYELVNEKLISLNHTLCDDFDLDPDATEDTHNVQNKKSPIENVQPDISQDISLCNNLSNFEPVDMPGTQDTFDTCLEDETIQVLGKNMKTIAKISCTNPSKKRNKGNDIRIIEPAIKKKEFPVKTSTNNFQDIGGNDKLLKEIVKKIKHIIYPEIIEKFKKKSPPRGFLLHGPSGCGKTLLARAIAGQLQIPLLEVAATDLVAGITGESEGNLRDLFDQVTAIAPCVLFFDKIDCLATSRENVQKGMEKRIVHQLCACLDKLNESENKNKILVLGTTDQLDCLDQSLRTPGRFEEEIQLSIPNKDARIDILKILTKEVKLAPDVNLSQLAQLTPGYVASELDKLINEAEDRAINRITEVSSNKSENWEADLNKCPTADQLRQLFVEERDFEAALKIVKPSVKKDEGFVTVPNVTWDDVGSLRNIREELQLDILAPIKFPEMYDEDSEVETGILLCGPPGCGKTLLAKAMANEAGLNFISVKGPEFLNKYVGESEKNVRKCFTRARNAAPCIIFFDELDALCPKRSEVDGNATSRVVNAMLTELDGVSDRKDVFVMAATNRPEIIDPALLRSGRFDKILYVGLPKPEDRLDILRALTKNGTKPKLSDNVNLEEVANEKRCEGFSGADLKGLVKQARREFVRDKINDLIDTNQIQEKHFDRAFRKIKATVKRKHLKRYKKLEKLYSTESVETEEELLEEPQQELLDKPQQEQPKELQSKSGKMSSRGDRGDSVEIVEPPIDRDLLAKVKMFLSQMKKKKTVITVTEACSHLQNEYIEYRNVNSGILRTMVRQVFDRLVNSSTISIATPRDKQKKKSEQQGAVKSSKRTNDESVDLKKRVKKSRQEKVHVSAGCSL